MPVPIGLLYLNTRRTLLEKYNLLAVRSSHGALFDPKEFPYRTGDGKYNDPHNAKAGSQYTFFGRNMKPVDQQDEVLNYTLFTKNLVIFLQNSKFLIKF